MLLLFLCDPQENIVQLKVGQSGVLMVSFIYNKTSPSKGGMIGTVGWEFDQYIAGIQWMQRAKIKHNKTLSLRIYLAEHQARSEEVLPNTVSL